MRASITLNFSGFFSTVNFTVWKVELYFWVAFTNEFIIWIVALNFCICLNWKSFIKNFLINQITEKINQNANSSGTTVELSEAPKTWSDGDWFASSGEGSSTSSVWTNWCCSSGSRTVETGQRANRFQEGDLPAFRSLPFGCRVPVHRNLRKLKILQPL